MTEQKKSDQTRQKILTAGRALISKHGFGAVGLARILRESDVPKGSFYYYFPSKDAFGQALLHDYVDDYLARMDALCSGSGSARDKLLSFWSAWLVLLKVRNSGSSFITIAQYFPGGGAAA